MAQYIVTDAEIEKEIDMRIDFLDVHLSIREYLPSLSICHFLGKDELAEYERCRESIDFSPCHELYDITCIRQCFDKTELKNNDTKYLNFSQRYFNEVLNKLLIKFPSRDDLVGILEKPEIEMRLRLIDSFYDFLFKPEGKKRILSSPNYFNYDKFVLQKPNILKDNSDEVFLNPLIGKDVPFYELLKSYEKEYEFFKDGKDLMELIIIFDSTPKRLEIFLKNIELRNSAEFMASIAELAASPYKKNLELAELKEFLELFSEKISKYGAKEKAPKEFFEWAINNFPQKKVLLNFPKKTGNEYIDSLDSVIYINKIAEGCIANLAKTYMNKFIFSVEDILNILNDSGCINAKNCLENKPLVPQSSKINEYCQLKKNVKDDLEDVTGGI